MSPRSVWRVTVFKSLGKLVLSTVLVGVLIALGIAPIAGIGGVAVARTNETMQSDLQDLTDGDAPGAEEPRERPPLAELRALRDGRG